MSKFVSLLKLTSMRGNFWVNTNSCAPLSRKQTSKQSKGKKDNSNKRKHRSSQRAQITRSLLRSLPFNKVVLPSFPTLVHMLVPRQQQRSFLLIIVPFIPPFLSPRTLITQQAQTHFSFILDAPAFFSLLPPLLALWEAESDSREAEVISLLTAVLRAPL